MRFLDRPQKKQNNRERFYNFFFLKASGHLCEYGAGGDGRREAWSNEIRRKQRSGKKTSTPCNAPEARNEREGQGRYTRTLHPGASTGARLPSRTRVLLTSGDWQALTLVDSRLLGVSGASTPRSGPRRRDHHVREAIKKKQTKKRQKCGVFYHQLAPLYRLKNIVFHFPLPWSNATGFKSITPTHHGGAYKKVRYDSWRIPTREHQVIKTWPQNNHCIPKCFIRGWKPQKTNLVNSAQHSVVSRTQDTKHPFTISKPQPEITSTHSTTPQTIWYMHIMVHS